MAEVNINNNKSIIQHYNVNSDSISESQKLAHQVLKRHLNYNQEEIDELMSTNNQLYAIRDKLAVVRYVIYDMDTSMQISNCLNIMYPNFKLPHILPQMDIAGKFIKNTVMARSPEIKLAPGQILKIYTKISDFWMVRPRILVNVG